MIITTSSPYHYVGYSAIKKCSQLVIKTLGKDVSLTDVKINNKNQNEITSLTSLWYFSCQF